MTISSTIADKTVLVTGANRGLGLALVDEALSRGVARVYAGSRHAYHHADARVTPVRLDITDPDQIKAAVEAVGALDILVNNAGVALFDDLHDREMLERHLAVNLFGPYGVTEAFLPLLLRSRGAILNVLSLAAVAAMPLQPAYSISKAAALSLTQSLRARLAADGVRVHAVLGGPIDTEMSSDLQIPKTPPASVARAIFDGFENGDEEIFPDPLAEPMAAVWSDGPSKALERQMAPLVAMEIVGT